LAAAANSEGYADALQKAGYATDPQYAQKIKQLINSDSIRSATDVANAGAQS
jgi:flagellar protein FlgJ